MQKERAQGAEKTHAEGESNISKKAERLVSLDVLRGFDMFWIIGGSGLFLALLKFLQLPESWVAVAAEQMTHVQWEGFRFFDLIFPLFVFMSGITIPYSVLSQRQKGTPIAQLQWRIVKRACVLILLGLTFSVFRFEAEHVRAYTVLTLIGVAYLIGSSLALHVKSWRWLLGTFFGVLFVYHAAICWMPFPGKTAEVLPDNNLAAWLDRSLFPTSLYRVTYDPEGTIRMIPAGMLCLLGGLVGMRIKQFGKASLRCAGELAAAGGVSLFVGWLWSFSFPIIKDLWSPSFILWSGGWSLLLLAAFYLVLDVWKLKWLGFVFLPIGMNAITIYVGQVYFAFGHTRNFFFGGFANLFESAETKALIMAFGLVFVKWLLLFWLYRKKIFIRV